MIENYCLKINLPVKPIFFLIKHLKKKGQAKQISYFQGFLPTRVANVTKNSGV